MRYREARERAVNSVSERTGATKDEVLRALGAHSVAVGTALLTAASSSPKLRHDGGYAVRAGIVYLRPATTGGGATVCAASDAGCAGCLGLGGRALFDQRINQARQRRLDFYREDSVGFLLSLAVEIEELRQSATEEELVAVRLNGISDVLWERERVINSSSLMEAFPDVVFYDYTRLPGRLRTIEAGIIPANYDLSWSLGSDNDRLAERALGIGLRVVAVVRGAREEQWRSLPVVDGDEHDWRFLDPAPALVALKPKGLARKDTTGFVRSWRELLDTERVPRYGLALVG
jgi:hypothetical protein